MRLVVTVFDNASAGLVEEVDVTAVGHESAAELLGVPFENLVYVQPLNSEQVSEISRRTGIALTVDTDKRSYFLEGQAEFPGETWPPVDADE
ncbi:hypothetical protein GPX89_34270 [Nocardia sp. ET3-3]|uniref:DUF7683 domain-containing protein n=1 Tax=Nocardia terrae TaxID=2675851 RepID=A0A7K1V752_9NOCA|nr:hypothetical protein [Nocardia terrae]MVU82289.1 hypothetical protein [Nocardia terrae]